VSPKCAEMKVLWKWDVQSGTTPHGMMLAACRACKCFTGPGRLTRASNRRSHREYICPIERVQQFSTLLQNQSS
jgi:hypothetical protein